MNPLVERLGWVLVHSLWQFALVALLAGVIVRAMRRSSSAARYGVLVVAMAMSVAAPVTMWMLQPANAPPDHSVSREASALGHDANTAISPGADATRLASDSDSANERDSFPDDNRRTGGISPLVSAESNDFPSTRELTPPVRQTSWSERATTVLQPWLSWIVAGWSLGVVMCSLRPLLGWHTLRRLQRVGVSPASEEVLSTLCRVSQRLGLRRAVLVLQSTLAQVPVVVGYFRPVILLPLSLMTSLPAEQLEAILAHELAHVRRHDFIVNLLQTLVETLFFYHPAVWWLSHQIRVEREHCCDDLVVASFGNRIEYGRALLAIEELRGRSSVLALGAADGSLLSRIRRIVGINSDHTANERWPAAVIGLAFIVATCALSMTWSLAAKDGEKTEPHPATTKSAPKSKPENYVAELPNGVRVEFVGLAAMEAEPKTWWKPDGSPLSDVPKYGSEMVSVTGQDVRRAIIRVHGETVGYQDVTAPGMSSVMLAESPRSGGPFIRIGGGYSFPPGQKTGSFEVGIATQPQSPARYLNAKGQRVTFIGRTNSFRNSSGTLVIDGIDDLRLLGNSGIQIDIPALGPKGRPLLVDDPRGSAPATVQIGELQTVADHIAEDIEVLSIAKPPLRQPVTVNGRSVLSSENESDNKVLSQQTQITWRAPNVPKPMNLELILIDVHGKQHRHVVSGGTGLIERQNRDGTPHWGSTRRFFRFDVPTTRVAGFEYRVRPYQHWVTFDNVALNLGEMTDVKVKVESQPDRAGRGSPDSALARTSGLPSSDEETNPTNNANGDLRSNPAAGSGDPRPAQSYPRVFHGKITNAAGKPVAGALIEWGPDYPHEAPREFVLSADDGTYRLEVRKAGGKYKLGVSASGCAPLAFNGLVPGSRTDPTELDVKLPTETTLRIAIVDEAKQPILNLDVLPLTPARGFESSFSTVEQPEPIPGHSRPTTCDALGVCQLRQLLEAPEPLLKALAADTPAQTEFKQRTNREGWLTLRITRGGKWVHEHAVSRQEFFETNGLLQVVVPDSRNPLKESFNGMIFGQVVDADGKPVSNYHVTLRYRPEAKSVSDAAGRFEWSGQLNPSNSYEVRVFAKGFAPATVRIVPMETQRTQPRRIELKPHTSAEFVLLDEKTRKPIPKVIVVTGMAKQASWNYVEWNDLGNYADGHHGLENVLRVVADADGRISVPEGDDAATLLVLTPGYARTIVTPKLRPARNEQGVMPIVLPRGASIHGVVAKNSRLSRQADGVSLHAAPVNGFEQMFHGLTRDTNGECVIESLAAGEYYLSLDHSQGNMSTACWNKKITLKPGEKKIVPLGAMTGTLTLRGRTSPFTDVTLTRKPNAGAEKSVEPDGVQSVATIADVDGNFELDHLEAGSYSIERGRLQHIGGRSFGTASKEPKEIELTEDTHIDFVMPMEKESGAASTRARRGSPDPALDPTAGLPKSDEETKLTNNANGDLRSNSAAGSGDPSRAPAAYQFTGTVVDARGDAVAGALVLYPVSFDRAAWKWRTAKAQTNERGEFVLSVPKSWFRIVGFAENVVWAWAKDHACDTVSLGDPEKVQAPLRLTLPERQPSEFNVHDEHGQPVEKAAVVPLSMDVPNGSDPVGGLYGLVGRVPEELQSATAQVTDARGRVVLDLAARERLDTLQVTTTTHGQQRFRQQENLLRLQPAATVTGRLVGAPDSIVSGVRLVFTMNDKMSKGTASEVVTDREGRFSVPKMPVGTYRVGGQLPEPWLFLNGSELQIAGREPNEIQVEIGRGIPAKGKVVVKGTSRPIVDARVSISSGSHRRQNSALLVTNERGEFSAFVLPGQRCSIQVISFPEAPLVLHPPSPITEIAADATDYKFNDIACEPARKLTGKLIDESNRPIEGKYVGPRDGQVNPSRTNATGEFTLQLAESAKPAEWHVVWSWTPEEKTFSAEIVSETPLVIRVNREKAQAAPNDNDATEADQPKAQSGAQTNPTNNANGDLRSNPAAGSGDPRPAQEHWSVKGRVVDVDGKPMAGVTVRAATGIGTLLGGGKGETDTDGRYEFTFGPGIRFANNDVELQVATIAAHKAGFFEKNLSRQGDLLMARKLPEKLDWGGRKKEDIILSGQPRQLDFVMLSAAKLLGTLIDENEKPLVGYGVSLRGNELPPSTDVVGSTKTDEKGRFSISEIPTGFKFQILVQPAKRKPPWNAWASGPFEFKTDGGRDDFFIQEATREVAANRFELQIKGSGVRWNEAIKIGGSHQKLEPIGDELTSKSRLHAATIRLTLNPVSKKPPDKAAAKE